MLKNEEKLWNDESDMYLINEVIAKWKELQTFSKKKVFEKIAHNISNTFGKTITGTQADSKWKYLVSKYKNFKKTIASTGTGTIKWKYYEILNDFLFNKPEIIAPAICSSSKGLLINKCDDEEASGSQTVNTNLAFSPLVSSMTRKKR
ncbi:unnamed protein product [Psylliodes chrysocephalus]|uniref:Myb/SANT-like DNA-binding domain-containing protein n=1 Tax=Psylliodes chrysocephalus TaxID=3402493 RepID=A0A9P0GEW2_9CUCU|nr:unnamed protein product [Psylliodes chrysocephala]